MIREPAVSGSFYPAATVQLKSIINELLEKARPVYLPQAKAMIVPHAGYAYSGGISAIAYKLLQFMGSRSMFNERLKKILIIGPSHHVDFIGTGLSSAEKWKTPLGLVDINNFGLEKLDSEIRIKDNAHKPEHSIEVHLPFLQSVLANFTLTPLLTGEIEPERFSKTLLPWYKEQRPFILISSDLSHFYSYEDAKRIDDAANRAIPDLDIATVEAEVEACGKTGILTLLHMAKKLGWKGKLLEYKNSGDITRLKEEVVGYGCYAFY